MCVLGGWGLLLLLVACLKVQLRAPRNKPAQGNVLLTSVTTETGESWEGRCAGVSRSAKSPETV